MSKLQEIKFQGSKWIGSDTIRGLIDFIRGNFKKIKSLKSQLRIELKKFEINDYFENNAEIQGCNCIDQGLKLKKWIFKDKGLNVRLQNFRGQIEEWPFAA